MNIIDDIVPCTKLPGHEGSTPIGQPSQPIPADIFLEWFVHAGVNWAIVGEIVKEKSPYLTDRVFETDMWRFYRLI